MDHGATGSRRVFQDWRPGRERSRVLEKLLGFGDPGRNGRDSSRRTGSSVRGGALLLFQELLRRFPAGVHFAIDEYATRIGTARAVELPGDLVALQGQLRPTRVFGRI